MDLSGLLKAVNEFWNFVWPPVICLTILLAIAHAVTKQTFLSLQTRAASLLARESAVNPRALKRFGLDKLVPVIVAFFLLFVLDTARGVVVTFGQIIPPNVTYRYDLWLLQHSSDEALLCVWAHFENATNFDGLQRNIEKLLSEEEAQHSSSPPIKEIHQWEENAGQAYVAFSSCKFFILWALLWAAVEFGRTRTIWRLLSRLVVCLVIFSAAGAFYFFRHIWAIEQAEFSRINAAATVIFQQLPKCDASLNQSDNYRQTIETAGRGLLRERTPLVEHNGR